jgi:Bifunctional DNA primase/polymerase, N-terminal
VDWRGKGGGVLAPPSRHVSGGRYRWLRGLDQAPLPEVPAALRALLEPIPAAASWPGPTRPAELGHPYAQQALAAELAALGQARPRSRNRALNRCAFKVYRYVAGGLLDEQQVTAALTTAARSRRSTSPTLPTATPPGWSPRCHRSACCWRWSC